MSDFIFIAASLAFFAICVLYVHWCDKIIGPDDFPAVADDGASTGDGLPVLVTASVGADLEVEP